MMLAKGIAGASAILVSSLAFGGQFDYRIKYFAPNAANTNCYESIAEVAANFAESAGVEVVSSACYVDEYDGRYLDGIISYVSENRVKITKLLEYGNYGIEETALYTSQEACNEDIERQRQMFEEQTRLIPHFAHCYKKNSVMEDRWRLQLEAVGQAEIQHFVMGVDLYGRPARGYESYWQEISSNLSAKGIVISKAVFARGVANQRLTIAYYASSRKYLSHNGDVRLESPEVCAQVQVQAEASFAALSNPPVTIFCDQDNNGLWGSRINIYTLENSVMDPAEYRHEVLPGYYENSAACAAARPTLIDRLESNGVRVIEAICGIDSARRIVLHGFLRK